MEAESDSCSCEVLKVEIVNQKTMEDQLRNKLMLAMAGALGALLIEKGAETIPKAIKAFRLKRAKAKAEKKKN